MTPAEQLTEHIAALVRDSEIIGKERQMIILFTARTGELLASSTATAPVTLAKFNKVTAMLQECTLSIKDAEKDQQATIRAIATLFQQLLDQNTQLQHDLEAERTLNRR